MCTYVYGGLCGGILVGCFLVGVEFWGRVVERGRVALVFFREG